MRPVGRAGIPRHQRPVLVPDLVPDFGRKARRADRARVPGVLRRGGQRAFARCGESLFCLITARRDHGAAVGRDRLPHIFRQHRQRRFRIRADRHINRLIAFEILIIGADIEVAHADADELRARLDAQLLFARE